MAQRPQIASTGLAATRPASRRIPEVDALRGIAICAMIAYHFAFDLRYFRVTRSDFEHDPFWLAARAAILSSFLLLAGASLVLAQRNRPSLAHFWRHIAIIAGCALLVSAGSYAMFPQTFIWFGVLHVIAASLIVAQPLVDAPRTALGVGVAIVVAGATISHPAFDNRTWGWLGFMTAKPSTEDYVPLFPWAGLVFFGIAVAHAASRIRASGRRPRVEPPRWLAWAGRHSLAIYMVHQPLLIGTLWLVLRR